MTLMDFYLEVSDSNIESKMGFGEEKDFPYLI
jgi:hypothetical protein